MAVFLWDFLSGLLANDASMYACTPNLFSDFHVMLNPLSFVVWLVKISDDCV